MHATGIKDGHGTSLIGYGNTKNTSDAHAFGDIVDSSVEGKGGRDDDG